jgi:nucleotide-binding universal stress UspA family protein
LTAVKAAQLSRCYRHHFSSRRFTMSIKDILVHVDASPASDQRIQLACRLAHRFGAHLTGLSIRPRLDWFAMPPESGAAAMALVSWLDDLIAASERLGEQFKVFLKSNGVAGEWHMADGPPAFELTRWGNTADLVILGQSDPQHRTELRTPEDVVLGCGRPVLMVPYAGSFVHVGKTALVAWDASSQAARAAHDALALLAPTAKVSVLSVSPSEEQRASGERLAAGLARHGFSANAEIMRPRDLAPAEAVLSSTAEGSGDLIVMGAYSHTRVRELILGGMTRDMLRGMTVPVLMAH